MTSQDKDFTRQCSFTNCVRLHAKVANFL